MHKQSLIFKWTPDAGSVGDVPGPGLATFHVFGAERPMHFERFSQAQAVAQMVSEAYGVGHTAGLREARSMISVRLSDRGGPNVVVGGA